MTIALTNQRRVFKACLTQTERVSDDVTRKISPFRLYSGVHYCSNKKRKIQWHVHQYYFGPIVAPGEFIGPNIQQADNLSCLFLLALHNTSGACTYFLKDCSQSTFGFLLWRLRPKDPSILQYLKPKCDNVKIS